MTSPNGGSKSQLFVFSILAFNIICSVAIVGVNKYIYTTYAFPNITLTAVHFVVTYLGLLICRRFNLFDSKSLPKIKMLPLSATFCGFVVFSNLSLQYNTVGTFQVAKTLTTPCIMIMNQLFYRKPSSWSIRFTFLPVTLGVLVNSIYDLKFSIIGLIFAGCGVLVTSIYQVWVGSYQKHYQCNSGQLLFYQAPLSALLLLPVIGYFDVPVNSTVPIIYFTPGCVLTVLLSSFIAFFVNYTIYWIIGSTSALTYNMAGHLKFCGALFLGYFAFSDPITKQQFAGILLVVLGVFSYSYFSLKEKRAAELESVSSSQSAVSKL